jgi:hypothetical protein
MVSTQQMPSGSGTRDTSGGMRAHSSYLFLSHAWLVGHGFGVEGVKETGRCSTAAGHASGGHDRADCGVDIVQHTVRTLTAAHAARDGAPRAQIVDGYVLVATVGTIGCGGAVVFHGEQVPDDDAAHEKVGDERADACVVHGDREELRIAVGATIAADIAQNTNSGMDKRVAIAVADLIGRDGLIVGRLVVVQISDEIVAIMVVVEELRPQIHDTSMDAQGGVGGDDAADDREHQLHLIVATVLLERLHEEPCDRRTVVLAIANPLLFFRLV